MADYCELCDLPFSTCVHGMPPPPPPPPAPVKPARRAAAPRSRATAAPAARPPAPPKLTTPEAMRPHLLAVLTEAGGALDADDVYARLEERLTDQFRERDLTTTPEGELRWRLATRKARQSLITDGDLVAGPGEWRLT